MNPRDESPRERLSRALAAAAPPAAVLEALNTLPDVAPGQLWRARRGSRSALVLIIGVDDAIVDLVPVSVDDLSNADAVDLPAGASPLGAPLTVWTQLAASVPMRTLEKYLGALQLDHADADVLGAVAGAGRPGPTAASAAEQSVVFAARMADTVEHLAAAPLPGGTGELPSMLKAAGVPMSELGSLLGVPSAIALELRRGERALSAEQARALAPALGRSEEDLLAANPTPPQPLVAWMSKPPQRRRVIALARAKNLDEDRAFAHATFSTFALAARAAGDREADSKWAALGERYFQSVLDEP